jgi:hypothetical protein
MRSYSRNMMTSQGGGVPLLARYVTTMTEPFKEQAQIGTAQKC